MFKFKEEKVYFGTSDGLRLCGILSRPVNGTDKCIVLCHGITVDKEEDGILQIWQRNIGGNLLLIELKNLDLRKLAAENLK